MHDPMIAILLCNEFYLPYDYDKLNVSLKIIEDFGLTFETIPEFQNLVANSHRSHEL